MKPRTQKSLLIIFQQSGRRIRDQNLTLVGFLLNIIHHNKMVLIPMKDTRQTCLRPQLLPGNLHSGCPEANALRGIADSQQRHSFPRDMAFVTQCLQAITLAIICSYDFQTRRPTIHGIMLKIMREKLHQPTICQFILPLSSPPASPGLHPSRTAKTPATAPAGCPARYGHISDSLPVRSTSHKGFPGEATI